MNVSLVDPNTGLSIAGPEAGSILRLVDDQNYTDNFGLQWNRFAKTQLDRAAGGSTQSRERFWLETGWTPDMLDDQDVLEVGSGAGRFSRVVLEETRARLWSLDYSSAVDANLANNGALAPERFQLFQASIYEMPFPDNSFDKVFCLGVLQHTPVFEKSVSALVAKAKKGAEIVVDFYPIRGWWTKIHAKYLLRPITRRMPHDRLLGMIERNVDGLMAASALLDRSGLHAFARFLPVCDIRGTLPREVSAQEKREWVILDTFDAFSPRFDNPQRVDKVARMFTATGAAVTFAGFVKNGANSEAAVVRAIKR